MDTRSRLRNQNVRRRRLVLLVLLLAVSAVAVLWYVAREKPEWLEQARLLLGFTEYRAASITDSIRGTIYDRNYKELAVSYERVSMYANIREIENLAGVVGTLSGIIGIPPGDLADRIEKGSLRTWLAKDISQEQEEEVRELGLPGIHLHREYVRYYPQQAYAAHLIGFVEGDTGLSGLEYYLNKLETSHRLDKGDGVDRAQPVNGKPGADGRHLILTLDLKIQRILERYLENVSVKMPGTRVGALVMEAGSGALIGYAQVPSFDPNNFHTYPKDVFTDIFNETLAVPDPFKIYLRDVSLLQSQSGPGVELKPWSIVENRRKLGIQLQLWDKLGAGSRGQPDFISLQAPLSDRVAHDTPASVKRDFETVPVMQTPLQLLTAVSRTVNGGVGVTPHASERFVLRRNQKEFLLEALTPALKKNVLHDGVSGEARELFRVMAEPGPLGSSLLEGRSTSYHMNGGMNSFRRHDVLMAVIPVRNPELVVMVVTSSPGYQPEQRDGTNLRRDATQFISPIVALQRVMKNLSDMMSPGETGNINYSGSPAGDALTADKEGSGAEMHPEVAIKMPLLKGMSLRKSLRLLQGVGVEVEVRGTGRVVDQQPVAGKALKQGEIVVLILERDKVDAHFKKDQDDERK